MDYCVAGIDPRPYGLFGGATEHANHIPHTRDNRDDFTCAIAHGNRGIAAAHPHATNSIAYDDASFIHHRCHTTRHNGDAPSHRDAVADNYSDAQPNACDERKHHAL